MQVKCFCGYLKSAHKTNIGYTVDPIEYTHGFILLSVCILFLFRQSLLVLYDSITLTSQ